MIAGISMRATMRVVVQSFWLQAKDRTTSYFFWGAVFVQPIIFSLIALGVYNYGHKLDRFMFAILGAGLMGVWNANLWASGAIVAEERQQGTLEFLLVTPTSLEWVLLGKSLSNAVASVIGLGISLLTGAVVTGRWPVIADPLNFLLSLILSLLSLAGIGLILGNLFVLSRTAGNLTELLNFPIFILSGLSFPLTLLPIWTRPLSWSLPTTWANLAITRAAGQGAAGMEADIVLNYLVLIILVCAYLFIGHRLYRATERRVRRNGTANLF